MMNCSNPLPGTNFCEVCNTLVWDDSYTCDCMNNNAFQKKQLYLFNGCLDCHVVCHKRCIVKLSGLCSVQSGSPNNNKVVRLE